MTTPAVEPDPSPGARDEVRVSVVTGDRMCARCGYNLTGQTVIREPHYGLLLVRCPECATAASVQEYPVLGRWANRWGAVLAVLWLVFLLGLWFASGAATFGWSIELAEDAARGYGDHIQTRMFEDQNRKAAGAATGSATGVAVPAPGVAQTITYGPAFTQWWKQQDQAVMFADAGGWRNGVRWSSLVLLVPGAIASFAFGLIWAVALLRLRRRWLPVWGLLVIAMAGIFATASISSWLLDEPGWAYDAARARVAPPILLVAIAISYLPLVLGLYCGRPLTRLGLRLLLPPSLRGTLAVLWTAEGLTPPRPGGAA